MNDQAESIPEEGPASEDPDSARPVISALSVQATAIIRAIDALGALSWWSLGGMALTGLLGGLIHLQRDVNLDSVFIGEYQIPTEFLPHFGVAFGVFLQWMLATRVLHICRVFRATTLRVDTIRDMVRLNPPMINFFESSADGKLMSGMGVFVAVWAIFYGNLIGLMLFLFVGDAMNLGNATPSGPVLFLALLAGNAYFLVRHLRPALSDLHRLLYSSKIQFGVRRSLLGALLFVFVSGYQVQPLFSGITEQDNGLLGPVLANAVDGDTLFVNGWQVDLFGVDAVESGQTCLLENGEQFACGAEATAHLQALVQDTPVLCWPLVSTSERTITAPCLLHLGQALPQEDGAAFRSEAQRPYLLARRLVLDGYAIPMGVSAGEFAPELELAQRERRGVWRASVEPPWMYRKQGAY